LESRFSGIWFYINPGIYSRVRDRNNVLIRSCHCEDPECIEGDAAISPMDSGNVTFYDQPVG